jgi:hypothetical protein
MKNAAPMESTSKLITPPNSNETKIYSDFSQRDHRDAGALYDSASETSPMTSFVQPNTSTHRSPLQELHTPVQQDRLTAEEEREVHDWHKNDTPYWLGLIKAGIFKPEGVDTWEQWKKWRADNGQPIVGKPTLDEYYLAASFLGSVGRMDRRLAHPSKDQSSQSKVIKPTSVHRKTGSSGRSVSLHTSRASVDSPRRVSRTNNTKASSRGPVGETKSARAPSTKLPKDTNWRHYPDYSPNKVFDTMDPARAHRAIEQARNFAEKKTLNLMQDPDVQFLHPFELKLAERLVLDCSRFLCSKRQIFQGYVDHLQHKHNVETKIRRGLENRGDTRVFSWNKTAAQGLMGIDVTKGSWLWSFYNEIGFFEEQYFENEILSLEDWEREQDKERAESVMFK